MCKLENQTEKVMESFKELEEEWGKTVLINHLVDKTKLRNDKLRTILKELKSKGVISEPREGCFIRKNQAI